MRCAPSSHAAGTGRQYTGTAGRIENAIVAVYASYATAHGHALVERGAGHPQQGLAGVRRHRLPRWAAPFGGQDGSGLAHGHAGQG